MMMSPSNEMISPAHTRGGCGGGGGESQAAAKRLDLASTPKNLGWGLGGAKGKTGKGLSPRLLLLGFVAYIAWPVLPVYYFRGWNTP